MCAVGVFPSPPQDPLNCLPDEIIKSAKEKYHPNLNKAFADAGMPWAQGKIGGEGGGIGVGS